MAKKVYAVKGLDSLFYSWWDIEAYVKGRPGVLYKGFSNELDAQEWLERVSKPEKEVVDYVCPHSKIKGSIRVTEDGQSSYKVCNHNSVIYYVDGSYNERTAVYGSGMYRVDSREEFRCHGSQTDILSSRNVAGEVIGFGLAVHEAVKRKESYITIIADYEGVFRWAAPETVLVKGAPCWGNKLKKPIAKKHASILAYAAANGIKRIDFVWVRGHSGDLGNDIVDRLAKEACGLT